LNISTIRIQKSNSPLLCWQPDGKTSRLADTELPGVVNGGGRQPTGVTVQRAGHQQCKEVRVGRDYMVVLENQQQVEAVTPDISAMIPLDKMVCITAPGDQYDFVSRFFCPGEGVPEDPVTGSAHSMLIPYWSEKLGKTVKRPPGIPAGRGFALRIAGRSCVDWRTSHPVSERAYLSALTE
jgi:hypothetical protein